ncbi:MAG: hypothetical protein RLZZ457_755 [Pseudomonadota bacterium]
MKFYRCFTDSNLPKDYTSRMKKPSLHNTLLTGLMTVLAGLSLSAHAQEVGKVISSTPIIQQVAVPRQVCNNEQVVTQGQKSGAGAAMGAIAGGAIGNSMGQGSGRAAATMLGLFGGAILGDKVEGPGTPEVRNVQNCSQQMFYENRTMAYNVVYEFAGKQYTVQMPTDPGPTVRLQVTPIAPPPASTGYGVPPTGSAPRY